MYPLIRVCTRLCDLDALQPIALPKWFSQIHLVRLQRRHVARAYQVFLKVFCAIQIVAALWVG